MWTESQLARDKGPISGGSTYEILTGSAGGVTGRIEIRTTTGSCGCNEKYEYERTRARDKGKRMDGDGAVAPISAHARCPPHRYPAETQPDADMRHDPTATIYTKERTMLSFTTVLPKVTMSPCSSLVRAPGSIAILVVVVVSVVVVVAGIERLPEGRAITVPWCELVSVRYTWK